MLTLSPSASVTSLVTSKRLLGSSGSLPTSTSSEDARTAPVRSAGTIFAYGTLTLPATLIWRPLMVKSSVGEASICASGTSATRSSVPSR